MTFIQAARLGIQQTTPARKTYVVRYGANVGACLIGAALVAVGKDAEHDPPKVIACGLWPELDSIRIACPECEQVSTLANIIIHLIDGGHAWSRERTLAWLDSMTLDLCPTPAALAVLV